MQKTKISNLGIFTILLISSLTIMVGTVIAPSLSKIAVQLGFTKNPGWLVTLPSLGVVLFAPIMGRLIDQNGAYKILACGLIPYAILGFGGAFLSSKSLIIIDRVLLGAATAAIQASGTAMIAQLFEGRKRMQMIAWQGMAIELGGVVFLSIGGILGNWYWSFPFTIYLIAFICLIMQKIGIPQLPVIARTLNKKNTHHNTHSNTVIIVVSSLLSMILFFTAFVGLPLVLPETFKFSEAQTGYFMAFISLIAVVCASQMPKVAAKFGIERTIALGFIFFMIGLFLFYITATISFLFLGAMSLGIGFGLTVPLLNHWMVESSSPETIGKNLGYYSMGIFGGQFLSSFITGLFNNVQNSFLVSAIIGAIAALFFLSRKFLKKL